MDAALLKQHLDLEESHWWFVARREILLSLLDKELPHKRDLEILDAGCGGGATLAALSGFGRARGIEPDPGAVAYNRSKGRDVTQARVEDLPFGDAAFDLALALDVVEHVPDDLAALRELRRVLKPGGRLLLTVPALRLLWSAHDVANGHHRRYTVSQLRGRVEAVGLEPLRATYFNALLFPAVLAARMAGRFRKKSASDLAETPALPNALLRRIFALEAPLVARGFRLPVGVSALCLARRPGGADGLETAPDRG